jgi:hypothetical protein
VPASTWDDPLSNTNPALSTITWRDPAINRPEYLTLGAYYDTFYPYGNSRPWIVANASHWIYNGTGLTDGASMEGLVGYEWDLVPTGFTAPGLTVLSDSPMAGVGDGGTGVRQQATIWEKPNGAIVFNASTTYWPRFLGGDQFWAADTRIERMTKNLLDRMIASSTGATTSTAPLASASNPDDTTIDWKLVVIAVVSLVFVLAIVAAVGYLVWRRRQTPSVDKVDDRRNAGQSVKSRWGG